MKRARWSKNRIWPIIKRNAKSLLTKVTLTPTAELPPTLC